MAKKLKKVEIIGVSGVQGSFSEEAAHAYITKNKLKSPKIAYLVTVENVLAVLEDGQITLGIFPIQNSTMGLVAEAAHAMAKHRFHIKKIFEIIIHQNLLVKKGVVADKITKIVSQEPALKQCTMYLRRVWPKIKVGNYADTAKAAEDLAKGILPVSTAVIASVAAARLYKLDVLEESIQDLKFNYTTFIAATK
ncbi:MAG TPA: prephenate dehydratase domain-containing protein [Candidatus Paceibacterota bacterium]